MSETNPVISRKYFVFTIVFLGMLSAFGPFVTDMYLPTLPSMAEVFHAPASMVQMGLTASMIGLALGQLFFGPLSDRCGRKSILIASLILFSIATAISIFSPTIEFFNVARLFQGIGAAGGLVMSRSIATDSYSGRELAKMLAIIGAVNGIAPVTAPVVGGMVSSMVGWQGIFVILLGIGIVLLAMCVKFRETLPVESRSSEGLRHVYAAFGKVLRIRDYVFYLLVFGCANGVLFGYIASAPFAVQQHFGFSEMEFSIFFALNSIGIGIGTSVALKFKRMITAATVGTLGMSIFTALQLVGYLNVDNFWVYASTLFLTMVSMGVVFTSTTTLAMDAGRKYTGASSAMFGAIGFLVGGCVSPIVGIGNLMMSMSVTLLVASLAAFTMVMLARKYCANPE
jgi:DHA1 family bicyclomycin/chloramphenicol resistance-like MFS transporter